MTTIFYYSGRGNSLWAAREIARRLPEVRLVRITRSTDPSAIRIGPEDRLGFVVSVIDFGLPIGVRKFLQRLPPSSSFAYCFAAVTNGGMPAGTLGSLRSALRRKGYSLQASVLLPFSLKSEDASIRETRFQALCSAVTVRGNLAGPMGSLVERRVLTWLGNSLARLGIPGSDKSFTVSASCDGCGDCVKICPAGNIRLVGELPRWDGNCEQCGGCFAWCPKSAIAGTCLAAKQRYQNPDVTLQQMKQD